MGDKKPKLLNKVEIKSSVQTRSRTRAKASLVDAESNNSNALSDPRSSTLFGTGLAKAKKFAKKIKNIKNKDRNATIDSNVSSITSNISNISLDHTDTDIPQSNATFSPVVVNRDIGSGSPISIGSDFLGFTPGQVVPQVDNRDIRLGCSTPTSEHLPIFTGSAFRKRKSVEIVPDAIYGTDIPMTPILPKRGFTPVPGVASKSPTTDVVSEQSFFKIVLGSFCQFAPIFSGLRHQCTAMGATALAYNLIKPIGTWTGTDLDHIVLTGQDYYKESVANLHITDPTNTTGYLDAISLNNKLSISSQTINVSINMEECRGGFQLDHFVTAFANFESKNFINGIFTHQEYSYGLLRNPLNNSYYFFDSHGRRENGTRVIPDNDEREVGKAAILLFHNANDFIRFILKDYPLLPESEIPAMRNSHLVPLNLTIVQQVAPVQPEAISSQSVTIDNEEISFELLCGTYCENDGVPAPHDQHDCCGIVMFSFIYSTLHLILTWNPDDLSAIIDYGKIFYRKCYDDEIIINTQYDSTSTLLPRQFEGNVTFENYSFTIHASNRHFSDTLTKENIVNAIQYLQSFQNAFGILNIDGLSYGLTVVSANNTSLYIFFDSHGRTNNGIANGPYSAVLYFYDVTDIVNFLNAQFRLTSTFQLYPVQLERKAVDLNNSTTNNDLPAAEVNETESVHSVDSAVWNASDNIPLSRFVESNDSDNIPLSRFVTRKDSTKEKDTLRDGKRFFKLVFCSGIESDTNWGGHSHCIASCVSAIMHAYLNGMEWLQSDLKKISTSAVRLHSYCNEFAIEKRLVLPLLNIEPYIERITMIDNSNLKITTVTHDIGPARNLNNFTHFETAFRYFYDCNDYQFAILTICGEESYAICKCLNSGSLLFYDTHGRNIDGTQCGNQSVAIYFLTCNQFITFLENENENMYVFSLEFVTIEASEPEIPVGQYLFTRVITGTFAQNDIRFDISSRNTQCTANSVVFLAYASIVKEKWTRNDIDSILTLGDQIYKLSFSEAEKRGPRHDTLLAAHEVLENISVNINRFNRGVLNIFCQSIPQKEYSGNFGKFGEVRINRFFRNYNNGVFISCKKSVALHKFKGEYIVFDPHARTAVDLKKDSGKANIFFFSDISLLYKFLCCCGYKASAEFTLTPFNVTEFAKPNERKKVVAPPKAPIQSDISQVESVRSVRSLPVQKAKPMVGDKRTKSERRRDTLRNQRRYAKTKAKIELLPEYEQEVRRRWTNYCAKVQRTHTANVFGDFKNYKEFYDAHMADADSDEELVEVAHRTVKKFLDDEHRRQVHMLKNAIIPTHLLAFGNHEEIDETDEMYALYELSPMDQKCPHCGALYFKEECNSRKIFRTCCNFGEIHSQLPEQQARTYPPFLRDLLLGSSPLSREFLNNIMLYNNVLSFASMGTTTMHFTQARGSLGPVVAIEGMIYHFAEHFHTNSTGVGMPTAQLYYMDNKVAVDQRISRAGCTLNRSLMIQLENFMRANNPLTEAYRMLKEVLDEVRRRTNVTNTNVHLEIVRNRDEVAIRQQHRGDYGIVKNNEVAAVYTHLPSATTKNIVVFPVDQPPESGIGLLCHDPNRDAMMYPILFPYAEQTWTYTLMRRQRPGKNDKIDKESSEEEEESSDDELNTSDEEQEEGQPWRDLAPWEREETGEVEEEESDESEEEDSRLKRLRKPRQRITVREFFCYLLMLREDFSPLLNAGKLTQQFIIDAYARCQDNTFEYLESDKGQAQIRSETYGALKDYVDRKKMFQGELPGKLIVMPDTVVGSRQYMKQRYSDGLAMVAKYGKPTFFLTMTCNPQWNEIKRWIPKNANPVDHPDIVARVFKAKVKEFITDIYKRHVMGRCVAYLGVIEWQKRSLPHCHLVSFNSTDDKPTNPIDVDNFVSAEIPDPQTNPRLYKAVTTYMSHHRCDHSGIRASCQVRRKGNFTCPRHPKFGEEEDKDETKKCICYVCSKHFPRKFGDTSELHEGGYPTYRRRHDERKFISSRGDEIDNRWIVAYNPYLLLKYNCHINVEITSQLKSIKYLFKYLNKGMDMARLKVKIIDNVQVYNEFEHFVDCRYLSAGESIWKLYDSTIFYQSHTIYGMTVHLEGYQNVIFDPDYPQRALERTGSELMAYFELNREDPEARQYLFCEIPLYYVYNKGTKRWHPREKRGDKTLARLYTVNYNKIELYSLRLLLLTVRGAQSYEDIRTVNDIQYETFAQAASALGLLDDDSMQIATLQEIVDEEMPYRIRCLFVNMLVFHIPKDVPALWRMFKAKMYEDYVRKGCEESFAENLALKHISFLLTANGKSNSEFSLPEPVFAQGELETVTTSFDTNAINQANEKIEGARLAQMLLTEQRCIFDEIIDSVLNPRDPNKQRAFFVDGPGGTGKTFLFVALISVLRGMGLNALAIAWTGIAAALLKGGRTVHSTFKLPFDFAGPVGCHLSTSSDSADEIRKAAVIVWDEISMTPCEALDAVDKFLRDLMGIDKPFGGKIFVATGDFRQILPIVVGGSKYDILKATVKNSKLWPLLKHCTLKKNVRLTDPNAIEFAEWLLDVGEGKINDYPGNKYYNSYVKIPSECIEPNSLVDRIYGKSFLATGADNYSKSAILTTHIVDVDFLNNDIYKRLHENVSTEQIYYSNDRVLDLDENDDDAYDVSMLNKLTPPRLPPHELKLKVGCVVKLLCNLNVSQGLCNGTRVIVTKLYRTCIRAKILYGEFKGEEVLISRCRIESNSLDTSCKFQRIQIPVKLAFAMTINSSQGQTIDFVGIYLRKAPFAHGQLYVALSRARSKDKLLIQVFPDTYMGKLIPGCDDVFVPNIVYKEIF